MKFLICFIFAIVSNFANSQPIGTDAKNYLNNFDSKIYSLKSKGIKEFVVDIESSQFTKQMNDLQTFGKIDELVFRVYWTHVPERFAIEIIGLPEGFKEVKEDLKMNMMKFLEYLIPIPTEKKFAGYSFSTKGQREITAQDTSGLAPISKYIIKFDALDKIVEIQGERPVGTLVMKPEYAKEAFSGGRWVLKEQTIESTEAGQNLKIQNIFDYILHDGIGVLSQFRVVTEQKALASKTVANTTTDTLVFKNYKINTGEALKYFLGQ